MDHSAQRNAADGQAVARHDICVFAAHYRIANLQADRSQDIALFTVSIVDQGDKASTVRIIFNRSHFSGNAVFGTLEINNAVFSLVSAASMANGDTAMSVTAAGFFQIHQQDVYKRQVCRVVGTIALCTNVFDAGQLQYRTDRTARNNAGTFRSRKQQYQPFAKFPFDLVRNAGTYDRYANEVTLCILGAFTDRFRDLSCFAAANADQTVFVADDDQRSKAEVTSALYYFGYAVYGNKFFFQF